MSDNHWCCNWRAGSKALEGPTSPPPDCRRVVVNITSWEQGSWRLCLILPSSPRWKMRVNSLIRGQGSWREHLSLTDLCEGQCVIIIPVRGQGPGGATSRRCLVREDSMRTALLICINRVFSWRTTPVIGLNCHIVTVADGRRLLKSGLGGVASSSSTSMSPSRESRLDPDMPLKNLSYPCTQSDSPPSLLSRSISASGECSQYQARAWSEDQLHLSLVHRRALLGDRLHPGLTAFAAMSRVACHLSHPYGGGIL